MKGIGLILGLFVIVGMGCARADDIRLTPSQQKEIEKLRRDIEEMNQRLKNAPKSKKGGIVECKPEGKPIATHEGVVLRMAPGAAAAANKSNSSRKSANPTFHVQPSIELFSLRKVA